MDEEILLDEPSPIDPDEGEANVYPIPDSKHIGVSTNEGTDPEVLEGDDDEINRKQSGMPD